LTNQNHPVDYEDPEAFPLDKIEKRVSSFSEGITRGGTSGKCPDHPTLTLHSNPRQALCVKKQKGGRGKQKEEISPKKRANPKKNN
jgi:hypothetical protein